MSERLPYKLSKGGDLNAFADSGTYVINGAMSNAPAGNVGEGRLMVLGNYGEPRVAQWGHFGAYAELYFRIRYDWLNWTPWYSLHHSGNYPKIIRGSVSSDGYPAGGSGFNSTPHGDSVRISHALGAPLSYCFAGNLHRSGENGVQLEILDKGTDYIVVGVRGFSGNYLRVAFDFVLSAY